MLHHVEDETEEVVYSTISFNKTRRIFELSFSKTCKDHTHLKIYMTERKRECSLTVIAFKAITASMAVVKIKHETNMKKVPKYERIAH